MFQALLPMFSALFGRLVDLIPDPVAREKARVDAEQQLLVLLQSAANAQMEINKAEATSGNAYAAGWRPTIGYICGAALAFQFLIRPLGMWGLAIAGVDAPSPPDLDDSLWELMFGMLGLGGMRSFEKIKGAKTLGRFDPKTGITWDRPR